MTTTMRRPNPAIRACHRIAHLACLIALMGCDSTNAPTPADANQARQLLEKALTAWTKGETVEAMKKASPAITISDSRWERGDALKGFEITGEGQPSGAERLLPVTLRLTDARGKEKSESVQYRVGTDPVQTVFRSAF